MKSQKPTEPHGAIRRRKVSSMLLRGMRRLRDLRGAPAGQERPREPRDERALLVPHDHPRHHHDAPLLLDRCQENKLGAISPTDVKGEHPVAGVREAKERGGVLERQSSGR